VVGGGEVFVYRVFGADSVGGKVVDGREGGSLEFEDEAADSFGVEFDNDGRGGGVLLGGNGEGIGEDEVGGGMESAGMSPACLAASRMGLTISRYTMVGTSEAGVEGVTGSPRMRRELERRDWSILFTFSES